MKEKIRQVSKVTISLVIVFSLLLVTFIGLTMAYFTDSKSYTGQLSFGDIKLKVTDSSGNTMEDKSTMVFDITRTGTVTTKLMPGDTVNIKFNVALDTGSEPAYYLVSVSDSEGILDNATYYSDGSKLVKNTDDAKSVGEIAEKTTHKFEISQTIPATTDASKKGTTTDVTVKVYAVQKANLTKYDASATATSAYHILIDEMTPKYTRSGNIITFGSYPQTYAGTDADALGITDTTESGKDENGYYTGTGGTKYAKITTSPFYSDGTYSYSNGTTITATGETAYFKVEPLQWRVIKEEDGVATLVCMNAIDAMKFQNNYISGTIKRVNVYFVSDGSGNVLTDDGSKVLASNYKYSSLRDYLNDDFYSNAFNTREKCIIPITEVDNNYTTKYGYWDMYTCDNTEDHVFALSFEEVQRTNNVWGEALDSLTYENTDYALAVGAIDIASADSDERGWWLRSSPYYTTENGPWYFVNCVGKSGITMTDKMETNNVVPALRICL